MLLCPFCQTEIDDDKLRAGRCSQCGGLVMWEDSSSDEDVSSDIFSMAAVPREKLSIENQQVNVEDSSEPGAPQEPAGPADETGEKPLGFSKPGASGKTVSHLERTIASDSFYQKAPDTDPPRRRSAGPQAELDKSPDSRPFQKPAPTIFRNDNDDAADGPPVAEADIFRTLPRRVETHRSISVRSLSPDEEERVQDIWRGTYSPGSSPYMTIKNTGVGSQQTTDSVVVKTRVVLEKGKHSYERPDYTLLDKIGEGGVGVVYEATQTSINRTVALKMLRSHTANDLDARDKFLTEAVVTGELDHPNIVPVYDLGADEQGATFYSMKRVEGTPWSTVIGKKGLQENLEILMKVADALAFAHDRGVIHRDLKPENVMLGNYGEVLVMDWGIALSTSAYLRHDVITQSNSMGGTPAYMAPEMATGPLSSIGPRSDVYLLGAVLFEILTGLTPHTGHDVLSCLKAAAQNEIQICEQEGELLDIAYKAMETNQDHRYKDVHTFQEAIRTYQSHSESILLAVRADEDLHRARESKDYQDFSRALFAYQEALSLWPDHSRAAQGIEDVQLAYATTALAKGDFDLGLSLLDDARPSHRPLRQKLLAAQVERDLRQTRLRTLRRTALALGVSMMIILVVGLAVTFDLYRDADEQRELAKKNEADANTQKGEAEAAKVDAEEAKGAAEAAAQLAKDQAKIAKDEKERADERTKEAREQGQRAERASYVAQIGLAAAQVQENAFLEARRVVKEFETTRSVTKSGARHWEWGRLKFLSERAQQTVDTESRIEKIAWMPDGDWLLVATAGGDVRLWNVEQKRFHDDSIRLESSARALAVSPRDGLVATAGDASGLIEIWELGNLVLDNESVPQKAAITLNGHEGAVVSLRFSEDGQFLLSTSLDSTARLWNVESEEEVETLGGHTGTIWDAAISGDNRFIYTAGDDRYVGIWDRESSNQNRFRRFGGHSGPVYAVSIAKPPEREKPLIISGGRDRFVLAWDPSQIEEFDYVELEERMREITLGTPTRSSRSASRATSRKSITILAGHTGEVRSLHVSPEGKWVISGGHDNTVRVWNPWSDDDLQPPAYRVLRGHGGWVRSVAHHPQGNLVASGGYDQLLQFWDLEAYVESFVLSGHDDSLLTMKYSADGKQIITAGRDGRTKVWEAKTGKEIRTLHEGHDFLTTSAAFFPPGDRRMVTGAGDGTTIVWRLDTGGELRRLDGTGPNSVVAVSAKGNWIATGSTDSEAKVWLTSQLSEKDDTTPKLEPIGLVGHKGSVTAAAFHPMESERETHLFTGDELGTGILWRYDSEAKKWETQGTSLNKPTGQPITAARFLPDGSSLLTASATGTITQWRLSDGVEIIENRIGLPGEVRFFDISPDGKRAAAAYTTPVPNNARDGEEVIWHLESWELETPTERQAITWKVGQSVFSIAFDPSGEEIILATDDAENSVWKWNPRKPQESNPQHYWPQQRLPPPVWLAVPVPGEPQILTLANTSIRIWYREKGVRIQSFGPHNAITSASFSPNGKRAVTGSTDGTAKIWDVDRGRVLFKLPARHLVGRRAGAIHVAEYCPIPEVLDAKINGVPADDVLLTAGADGTARLWALTQERYEETQELYEELESRRIHDPGESPIRAATFSPDALWIVTGSADGSVRVWDSRTGKQVHEMDRSQGHSLAVNHVTFSCDGLQLATGGDDNTTILWETALWQREQVLVGHTAAVTSVAFSPDRRRILTASRDGTGKLWETDDFSEVFTVKGHAEEINVATFSPDGRQVATAGGDGRAIVWLAEEIPPSLGLRADELTFGREQSSSTIAIDAEAEFRDPFVRDYGQSRLSVRVERIEDQGSLLDDPVDHEREGLRFLDKGDTEQVEFTVEGDHVFVSQPRRRDAKPRHIASLQRLSPMEWEFEFHQDADRFAIETLIRRLGYFADWKEREPDESVSVVESSAPTESSGVPEVEVNLSGDSAADERQPGRDFVMEMDFADGSPSLFVDRSLRFESTSQPDPKSP